MSATGGGTDASRLTEKDANGLWVIAAVIEAVCEAWDDGPLKTHFLAWSGECRAEAQRLLLEEQGSDAVLRVVSSVASACRN